MRSGDKYVGVTQAIMSAGGKSVVPSLWNVHYAPTHAHFEACYAQLSSARAPCKPGGPLTRSARTYPLKTPFFSSPNSP
ncbi:MAG: hypothetical protein ACPGWR_21020 [Ardenticatenaceae bacterium]